MNFTIEQAKHCTYTEELNAIEDELEFANTSITVYCVSEKWNFSTTNSARDGMFAKEYNIVQWVI